ncbi:MAG: ECF transporter S component [Erysipelotrichaceae bacterium]
MKRNMNVRKLVLIAMLAALAGILMSLEISVPFMPPFYKLDFSDVPAMIAIFTLGPVAAMWVELIKIVIKVVTVGTNTMYVGELANLIGIFIFVLPTWYVYKTMGKSKKAMRTALLVSIPLRTIFACCLNAFITLPMYAAAMGLSLNEVILSVSTMNLAISDLTTFIIFATIPFNVIKIGLNASVTYVLHHRLLQGGVSILKQSEATR